MHWVHSAVDPQVQDSAVVEERRLQEVVATEGYLLSQPGHQCWRGGRYMPAW